MATGAPDGVLMIQVAVTVENVPVVPTAANNYPIATYTYISTSSDSYQTIKELTVTTGRLGVLRGVEISCDNYAVAQFKLIVAGVTVFEDKKIPASFTKEFPDLEMSAGQKATLYVKSDGATTITAYCDFNYKEVG